MKRFNADYIQHTTNKKPKTDDLWGDDPDVEELEDCIIQATQQVVENKTFQVPSYSLFQRNDFGSSTQTNGYDDIVSTQPSIFMHETKTAEVDVLQEKIKELQMNYEAKVGEVTILRTQLKETKISIEHETHIKEKDVAEKLNALNKEVTATVTKLELKELENANLKSKIRDVTMRCTFTADKTKLIKLSPVNLQEFPLKNVSSELFFKDGCKKHYVKQAEDNGLLRNTPVNLNQIHPEILSLVKMDVHCLSSDVNNVNKVLDVTLKSLKELTGYLEEFEGKARKEMISRMDLAYIKDEIACNGCGNLSFFDSRPWCVNECDIHLRQLISLIGEIVPFNKRLCDYICGVTVLVVNTDDGTQKFIDDNKFLDIILNIVKKIGRTRKSFYYCGLLSAICLLLNRLSLNVDQLNEIFYEIMFSRPSNLVMHHFTSLLKKMNSSLIKDLCKYPLKNSLRKNVKKEIVYINKGCCILQIYCLIFENYLQEDNKNQLETYEKYLNLLEFISNMFYINEKFMYYQENQHYDCLLYLNKLFLNITYIVLEQVNLQTNKRIKKIIKYIIQTSVKLIINFKSLDFMEREVEIDILNKTVKLKLLLTCKKMDLKTHDVLELEKLTPSQDDASTPTEQLNTLQLWTDG